MRAIAGWAGGKAATHVEQNRRNGSIVVKEVRPTQRDDGVMSRTTRDGGPEAGALDAPPVSVIIPAFNEAGYLPRTLDRLRAAEGNLRASAAVAVEIVVVDNGSTDRTAEVAETAGVSVVRQPQHNIARVRNAGTAAALHDVLIFLDADTLVPADLLLTIAQEMADAECAGGAVDAVQQASSIVLRGYFRF